MPERKRKTSHPYILVGHARPAHRAPSLPALLVSQLICLRRIRALLRRLCAKSRRRCGADAHARVAGTYCGGSGRSWCGRLAEPGALQRACWRLGESRAAGLGRLWRAASCACGAAGATLRCMLASQAGLAAGWRVAARPSSMLARQAPAQAPAEEMSSLLLALQLSFYCSSTKSSKKSCMAYSKNCGSKKRS